MEAVIMIVTLVVIAILADRFGDRRRPVHHSVAYQQALTGMIREPGGQTCLITESRRQRETRAIEEPVPDLEPAPAVLAVQPT